MAAGRITHSLGCATAPMTPLFRRHVNQARMLTPMSRQRSGPARSSRFVDSTGRRWEVRELPGKPGAPPPRSPSLVFETEGLIRRVRRYPPNWLELPATELEALSWRT